MPVLRARQSGDMYVQVVVETPQNLTKKQRELLAEFDRLSSTETQPESSGFFGKVKDFLDGLRPRAILPDRLRTGGWSLAAQCSKSGRTFCRVGCYAAAGAAEIRTEDRAAIRRSWKLKKTIIERKIERQIRLFEQKRDGIGKKIEEQIRQFERKKGIRLDDEVRFIRSWIERPLTIGAVTPSGKILARTMARYVDPDSDGPVVELGPGTGPVTEALVEAGVAPSRLVLVEFNPSFCRILRSRYPGRHAGAGRCLQHAPPAGDAAAAAGRRGRFRPAACHQADQRAAAADPRRLRSDAAGRAVRAVHLFGGGAVAEASSAAFRWKPPSASG